MESEYKQCFQNLDCKWVDRELGLYFLSFYRVTQNRGDLYVLNDYGNDQQNGFKTQDFETDYLNVLM